jgi:hypothetical protein
VHARDGTGCPDADDAVFTERFADQVLDEESHLARRKSIPPQPPIIWRQTPIIDATAANGLSGGQPGSPRSPAGHEPRAALRHTP